MTLFKVSQSQSSIEMIDYVNVNFEFDKVGPKSDHVTLLLKDYSNVARIPPSTYLTTQKSIH